MRGFIHPVEELFEGIANAAIAAVAVVLLVWLVDRLAGRRLSPGIRAALWLLVAARLVMPTGPDSALSVQRVWSLFERAQPAAAVAEAQNGTQASPMTGDQPSRAAEWERASSGTPASAQPARPTRRSGPDWDDIIFWTLMFAWPAGVAWVLLRAAYASARFAWRLHSSAEETADATVDVVLHACDEVGVCRPRIKRVPGLGAPALFGVLRPTLCLPLDSELSTAELRMIALHEAAHLRRRDCLVAWLLTPIRALHWCNPIAWLALGRYERYREQACDEAVRRRLPASQLTSYADLLLRFASAKPAPAPGLVGLWFARSARELGARIEALDEPTPGQRRVPKLVGVALLAVVAVATLTDPAVSRSNAPAAVLPKQVSPYSWTIPPGTDAVDDELLHESYDLTDAVAKIAEVRPEEQEPQQWLLKYLHLFDGEHRVLRPAGSNRVLVRSTREGHRFFANLLGDAERFGHTWQVVVSTRVFRAEDVESLPDVDWKKVTVFPPTDSTVDPPLPSSGEFSGDEHAAEEISLSTESVSFEYAPHLAVRLSSAATDRLMRAASTGRGDSPYSAPKVTLFNGQEAMVIDRSQTPFVVGVEYVEGEHATAAQPTIAVLPEGARVDVRPRMVDADTVDLNCRLVLTHIGRVGEAKLPGQDIVVQTPRIDRKSLSARCRLKKGQTLLLAPLTGFNGDAKQPSDRSFYYAVTVDWFADPLEPAN
ncbi:Regulatory protein BlaR1 [Posidoniimonas corsicana]|uniref:Regulatory protein BlaR1 n=1 Tax=Posidoniimonas corsicana TaxID=1938618 RepID=A0A5C5UXH9_9BACT|nr:M56 family metallopeptidase [Posidoniimonas corsicana]TWT30172.1 Regulatory protein BlaR1 [Posidoniimonas corsicana]